MKCWGQDTLGQLGVGGSGAFPYYVRSSPLYVDLGTGRTAVAVSAGTLHTCAILDDGDLKCWGSDQSGQLGEDASNSGTGVYMNRNTPTSVDLPTGRTAVAVAAGGQHTCAILDNGSLMCWGKDDYGQVGDGGNIETSTTQPQFVDLGTGRTAVEVAAGGYHTCAILDNGDLKCWGSHQHGQLGVGGTGNSSRMYMTSPPATAVDLGAGRTAVAVGLETITRAPSLTMEMKVLGSRWFWRIG